MAVPAAVFRRLYQYYAAVWVCWWLDVLAAIGTSAPVVADRSVPWLLRAGVLANHWCVWAIVLIVPALGWCGVESAARRWPLAGHIGRLFCAVLVWLAACVWLTSWILYGRTGDFLGGDWLEWVWQSFAQVWLHVVQVEEWHLYLLLMGAGILTVVWMRWWRGCVQRSVPSWAPRAVLLGTGWLLLGAVAPTLVSLTDRRSAPPMETSASSDVNRTGLFWQVLQYHTAPAARLLFDVLPSVGTAEIDVAHRAALVHLLTTDAKRIIPLESYLRQRPADAPRYNVILVFIESLRADRLRLLGGTRTVMPHLDQLAASSLVFSQAYCQSTHSDYADLCPLSSQYPLRSRRHHFYTDLRYPRVLLYDLLKGLGYRTAIFSSQNEEWGGMLRYLTTGSLDTLFHAATAGVATYVEPADRDFTLQVRSKQLTAGKLEDDVTVQAASRWIRAHAGEPFFLSMNLQSSHFPYRLPPGAPALFTPSEITFPASFVWYPPEQVPIMRNRYDNSLHAIDDVLQTLWRTLQTRGLFERTIVIVSGDNGEAFYEHGVSTHAAAVWEEQIHVAFMIHAPGVPAGIVRAPIEHIDIPPTVMHLLGLPSHPAFQGINVVGIPPERLAQRPLFFVSHSRAYTSAVRQGDDKLLYDWHTGRYALFDLARDPGETQNLLRVDTARFLRLRGLLRQWHALQLLYYAEPDIYTRYYPPSFE